MSEAFCPSSVWAEWQQSHGSGCQVDDYLPPELLRSPLEDAGGSFHSEAHPSSGALSAGHEGRIFAEICGSLVRNTASS